MTDASPISRKACSVRPQTLRSLSAFLCALALAGCGDSPAPDEGPHGPPGGLIDVNNGAIPLGEDMPTGRAGMGGGGGGSSNPGAAGKAGSSAQGGASGHLPPAK